jgi:hypothetical protein
VTVGSIAMDRDYSSGIREPRLSRALALVEGSSSSSSSEQ